MEKRVVLLFLAVSFCGWFYLEISPAHLLFINVALVSFLRRRYLKILIETLPRDIKGVRTLLAVESDLRREMKRQSTTASIFHRHALKYKDKVAFVDAESNRKLSFFELDQISNRVANYFRSLGLKKGDVVAIFATNRIEYVAFWLGLSKIGVISALINYNLRLQALGHCVNICNAKCLIVSADLQNAIYEAVQSQNISKSVRVFVFDGAVGPKMAAENLDIILKGISSNDPSATDGLDFKSVLLYIYTSGTTGMPKAAVITNARFFLLANGCARSFNITSSDTLYVCLPLYHSLAGIAGAGQALVSGSTVVIRRKFSASRFWDDCVSHKCTVSQYIGEICRYLLAQQVKPVEHRHCLRLMFGNNLRLQIWEEFVHRFHIKQIGELYASTEGNTSLLNLDNKVGACGFFPVYPFVYLLYPLTLIKVDENTGQPIRNANGICIRCKPGEHGEMVGKILKGNPLKEFHGYLSASDTNKKLIRDVFNKGDVAFSSGDILYMDEKGYLYFKDRTGDTFRWKGENVSTTEVEGVIHKIVGLNDATVYGVSVPGMGGKAGMAAIVDENQNTDLDELSVKLKDMLPTYAQPMFLRLCRTVETTGTYKLKKQQLQSEGYDPTKCGDDRLFYLNIKNGAYEPLTVDKYNKIVNESLLF